MFESINHRQRAGSFRDRGRDQVTSSVRYHSPGPSRDCSVDRLSKMLSILWGNIDSLSAVSAPTFGSESACLDLQK